MLKPREFLQQYFSNKFLDLFSSRVQTKIFFMHFYNESMAPVWEKENVRKYFQMLISKQKRNLPR